MRTLEHVAPKQLKKRLQWQGRVTDWWRVSIGCSGSRGHPKIDSRRVFMPASIHLVTGATSGIGQATAKLLVEQGKRVVGIGRSIEKLPDGVEAAQLDLRDASAIKRFFQSLADDKESIASLLNSAGLAFSSRISDGDPEDWRRMWEINVHALALCCQCALPLMEEDGLIINVSSQSGHRVPSAGGFYAPTKFAVRAITDALRK
ncbi:SDR family oxidoreductase, partial [Rhodopirellula sp. JC639]|uniref:SDR family oxidoreductase n=1 Tax=Stieleria mannarensis TaxID=2755585 RepID=UPI0016024D8F